MLLPLSLLTFVVATSMAGISPTKDYFRDNNQLVVYGTWRANDVICYRRTILRWADSPQIINFHNPTGAIITYIILQLGTVPSGFGGFRADLVQGGIGTNHVRLDVYAEPFWVPFFKNVYIEMRCAPIGRLELNKLYVLASLPEQLSSETLSSS
ncbi:uncharacterized protein LOC129721226 [Wyeomyia smithii]|uniref:uncharacterized protein LOC129721226 n=1 Tax=Wyeomyia smithii TaxID=174621 RepID=UPI0024681C7F|nr:uncharacterized protein LOC129721226 [Wyeomyia smithii]